VKAIIIDIRVAARKLNLTFQQRIPTERKELPLRTRLSLLPDFGILCGMFILIVASRLAIDTPNFQPAMAVALLGGMLLRSSLLSAIVVLVATFVSDLFLGMYDWRLSASVYACLALPALAGPLLRRIRHRTIALSGTAAGMSVLFAVIFYLVTNTAFWWFTGFYAHDPGGLMATLSMGLPFFKWSLLSNTVFTLLLTAVYLAATTRSRSLAAQAMRVPADHR
jgi:hypothetical protein